MLDRRLFLGAGIAGASALTFSSVWSQSAPNFGPPTLPCSDFRSLVEVNKRCFHICFHTPADNA